MRDRKAVARYAGLTGSPDESGAKRREQGLARAGNAESAAAWSNSSGAFCCFRSRARWHSGARPALPIAVLARKLLIALWRFVTTGEPLEGVILRPAG